MKKMLLLSVTLLALLLCAVCGYAADRFAALDGNADGKVTWEEFQAGLPGMKQAAFDKIDSNGDKTISLPEWDAFRKGHGSDGVGQGMAMPPREGKETMPLIRPPSSDELSGKAPAGTNR